jgi:hypothetical protein
LRYIHIILMYFRVLIILDHIAMTSKTFRYN